MSPRHHAGSSALSARPCADQSPRRRHASGRALRPLLAAAAWLAALLCLPAIADSVPSLGALGMALFAAGLFWLGLIMLALSGEDLFGDDAPGAERSGDAP